MANLDKNEIPGHISLSDNIVMFPIRTIGEHGNVYEGEVKSSVYGIRPCAIKFATISEQNVREADILALLGNNTNVVALIESGTYRDVFEERVYIALDKCHNENLRQYLANRKAAGFEFDLNQAIDFAKQIISGVTYIHECNVVHLDLKPSNILISQNLTLIKIADFGLSIILKSSKSKVLLRQQFGTNGYRPIESFGNGEVSQRTDIFSLGTVLLHILSNGNDIFGKDKHVFIDNIMNDVTDLTGLLVSNPIATAHLIKCMVSKERCRRPTIWEVSDHPCWSGEEMDCTFEYFADDEIDDTDTAKTESNANNDESALIGIEREKAFVAKMREMGFNRKQTIVVFDTLSDHLHLFNHRRKSMERMHPFHHDMLDLYFSAVTFREYIYVFSEDRSVLRLEYGDVTASWERMSDCIGDHGNRPPAVVSSNAIYLVSTVWSSDNVVTKISWRHSKRSRRTISRYDPGMDSWKRLDNMPTATQGHALICSKEYLYCIGGLDKSDIATDKAETMNLATMEWKSIASMTVPRFNASAAECAGKIFVFGTHHRDGNFTMEMYDPAVDEWTGFISVGHDIRWHYPFRSFTIDDSIYLVHGAKIIKYDISKNEWKVVSRYKGKMHFADSVVIKMSI